MGGGAPKMKTSPAEIASAEIAKRQDLRSQMLERETIDPLRQQMQPQIMQAMAQNPFQTSLSAADRAPIEAQFNQARASMLAGANRGGRLRSSMAGLERDRAQSIAGAANQARQLGVGRALQLASGAMPTAASVQGLEGQAQSGLNTAADAFNKRQEADMAAKQRSSAGMSSMIGTGVGLLGAAAMSF